MEKSFTKKVLAVVSKIPKGQVLTYGEVAKRAGSPRACRGVGSILKKNYNPKIPCHRVVPSPRSPSPGWTVKSVGEYNRGGPNAKFALLKKEGALK